MLGLSVAEIKAILMTGYSRPSQRQAEARENREHAEDKLREKRLWSMASQILYLKETQENLQTILDAERLSVPVLDHIRLALDHLNDLGRHWEEE